MNSTRSRSAGEQLSLSPTSDRASLPVSPVKVRPAVLRNAELNAIYQLEKCYSSLVRLASLRAKAKMSNSRVTGIGREIKDLIKVAKSTLG